MCRLENWLNNITRDLWKVWGAAFLYVCAISLFVQFILLPILLPCYHAGGGIFIGSPDCIAFNRGAIELAAKIKTSGWGAWELRAGGQAPIGIAAFIYALTWSKLWVLIPLNAGLHASAFFILFRILDLLVKNRNRSFLCALPFLLFPSNLQWVAQIHKDGFSILGVMLIMQGIVSLFRLENYKIKNWFFVNFISIVYSICGFVLIWLVRPKLLMMMQPVIGFLSYLLIVIFLIRVFKKAVSWKKALVALLSLWLISFMFSQDKIYRGLVDPGPVGLIYDNKIKPEDYEKYEPVKPVITVQAKVEKASIAQQPVVKLANIEEPKPNLGGPKPNLGELKPKVKVEDDEFKRLRPVKNYEIEIYWTRLSWLSSFIEKKFQSLAMTRRGFRFTAPEAGSNIDTDVGFNSVKSILVYLPRSAQIVFFAPFPRYWFSSKGGYAASPLMRKISALEMVTIYFALIFFSYAVWYWRKRIEIWVISIFCISVMLLYGLVVTNIGTLYRMRYPFITTLVALGIAGFFTFLDWLTNEGKD